MSVAADINPDWSTGLAGSAPVTQRIIRLFVIFPADMNVSFCPSQCDGRVHAVPLVC